MSHPGIYAVILMQGKNHYKILLRGLVAALLLVASQFPVMAEGASMQAGDIVYTKPLKAVIFSHKAHTQDIGLKCEWCHESTFEMKALSVQKSRDFTMESLCNEKYCGSCHNGDISFSSTTQCARCHIGVKGYEEAVRQGIIKPESAEKDSAKIAPPTAQSTEAVSPVKHFPQGTLTIAGSESGATKALFSHVTHLETARLHCTECHPNLFIMKVKIEALNEGPMTMSLMEKGEYCGACHNGKRAFSVSSPDYCVKCHPPR